MENYPDRISAQTLAAALALGGGSSPSPTPGKVYQFAGSVPFLGLPALSADKVGNVYDVTDEFTSTADFTDGGGKHYSAGTNVAISNTGTDENPVLKYDCLMGDLSEILDDIDDLKNASAEYPISSSASGTSFALTDAADAPLAGLMIEGRTTKTGDVIANVGDGGTLTVTSTNGTASKTATISTGLPLCGFGDWRDVLDIAQNVVFKRCENKKISELGIAFWNTGYNYKLWYAQINGIKPYPDSYTPAPYLVDNFTTVRSSSGSTPGETYQHYNASYADYVFFVTDTSVQDIDEFISLYGDCRIVYELDEPIEISANLTTAELAAYHNLRTFKNTTNITCTDSPQMTLDYMLNTENGASIGQVAENMVGFINSLAFVWNTPEMHRMIFRGKYLGDHVTAAQLAAIRNGSFDDLYIGDYWIMGGVNWRIADINYWLHCGDTAFEKPHLVIVPDTCLYIAKMNDVNITTGGYVGSKMYTENLNQAKTTINSLFVDMVLSHREYLVNAVSNGKASGGAWLDSTVELMNESMVYGHREFTPGCDGTTVPANYTIDKTQLALFALAPKFITNRANQWLRDVVSAALFALVSHDGLTYYSGASDSRGVRPVFAIG